MLKVLAVLISGKRNKSKEKNLYSGSQITITNMTDF